MLLKLYNTLTKKKEEFIPLIPNQVRMYTCGVTVYDECHIGHARSLYVFEVMRRYLEYRGFKVIFVRNITDIDDKIINRAKELKTGWQELVNKYIESYYLDIEALGVRRADIEPRATENITDMIDYISALIEKGFAYESGGDVYFSVRKFSGYGKLSGQSIEEMQKGARIEVSELKHDHLDFALWKKSKESEPFWESPWGKGRPGWHIECSVMSQKFLKTETIDVHAGGRDLVFPHHENEIAQSEALTGKTFSRYWIHHGLLTINNEKMSKSLGNFITIKDFIVKYKDVDLLKLFFLSAHYGSSMDFSEAKIDECRKQKNVFEHFFDKINNRIPLVSEIKDNTSQEDIGRIEALYSKFQSVMDDDFNTAQGLAVLFGLIDLGVQYVSVEKEKAFTIVKEKVEVIFDIFGLKKKEKEPFSPGIEELVKRRFIAKKNKDFKAADKIREIAREKGCLLEDNVGSTSALTIKQLKINPKS